MICTALLALCAASYTEDDFLSFTSRTSLVSSCAGGSHLAWVETFRGTSNVVGANIIASGSKPMALTNYSDDDGISIEALMMSDDGMRLLYTRATPSDTNPASSADPMTQRTTYSLKCDDVYNGMCTPEVVAPHMLYAASRDATKATFAITSDGRVCIIEVDVMTKVSTTLVRTAGVLADGCNGNPSLAWSPDGNTLAFSITRLDHSFIGLWTRGARRVRWVAPSSDSDRCPVWAPDGKKLAFVRLRDGSSNGIAGWLHQAPTFSIMVASISTAARPVLRSAPSRVPVTEAFREVSDGSYPGTGDNGYGARPLLWLPHSAALIFGSEASGHVHPLYVNAAGDVAQGTNSSLDLMPRGGVSCEAQAWTLDATGVPKVDYSATRVASGDSGRLVSTRLNVAQTCGAVLGGDALWIQQISLLGAPGPLAYENVTDALPNEASGLSSIGAGMVPLRAHGASLAYLGQTHDASTRVFLWNGPSPTPPVANVTTLLTPDVPPRAWGAFVKPRLVTFPSLDGKVTLHAQLFQPHSTGGQSGGKGRASPRAAGVAPAAIFTHGGSQRQMYAAAHFSPTYANLYTLCQQLVLQHGITVLSINYRSGVGYGRDYRLCGPPAAGSPTERRCGPRGALEYEDVKAGRAYLRSLLTPELAMADPSADPAADPSADPAAGPKVGIFGLSYGGLNCLQALSRDPHDYAAGACNAPVFNWISQLRYDGGTSFDPAPILPPTLHQLPVGPTSTEATPSWPAQSVENAAVAYASSPASFMGNITGPLLLIHGDLDEEVPYQESLSLARALRQKLGPERLQTLFFPDECHGECAYANQIVAHEATAAFLAKHLL